MAGLAYLFLPVSGLIAYFKGKSERVRFHGLQAVGLGLAWPSSLYLCLWVSPGAVQVAFAAGASIWLIAMAGAAAGRDPSLPGLRSVIGRAAARRPLD